MAFRDDRDALIAQRDALEAEVRDLRTRAEQAEDEVAAHQAKDRDAGREIVALRREVAMLRAKLGESAPPPKRRALAVAVAAGAVLAVTLAGGAAAFSFLARTTSPASAPPPVTSWHTPAPAPFPVWSDDRVSATELNAVVSRNRPSLRRCYEIAIRGLDRPPALRVNVRVAIRPSGDLERVTVTNEQDDSPELARCIASTVRRWRFPSASEPVVTEFPVVFAPGS